MSKEIYCGVDNPPKGSKRGSMKECAEKGQIRYYGLKKIDSRILEYTKNKTKNKHSKEDLMIKLASLRGKRKGINNKLIGLKDKDKKEELEK